MTDHLRTWLNERETIHGKATDIDEWPLSAGDALRTLPKLVRGVRTVLELHKPYRYYEHEDACPNHDEDHRAERHVEFEIGEYYCEDMPTGDIACTSCRDSDGERVDWPCDEYQKLHEAINDA